MEIPKGTDRVIMEGHLTSDSPYRFFIQMDRFVSCGPRPTFLRMALLVL